MKKLIAALLLFPLIVVGQSRPRSSSSTATSSVTASVSMGAVAADASFNLSTEGTNDWLCSSGGAGTVGGGFLLTPGHLIVHRKATGSGVMERTLTYFGAGANIDVGYYSDGPIVLTTTAADDSNAAALNDNQYNAIWSASPPQTGFGFYFDVPCKTTSQILTLHIGAWSSAVTIAATHAGGTTASTSFDSGAATAVEKKIPITFTCSQTYHLMRVKVTMTTARSGTPHIKFFAATLQ